MRDRLILNKSMVGIDQDGCLEIEWVKGGRRLSVFVAQFDFVKSWGPNLHTEMESGNDKNIRPLLDWVEDCPNCDGTGEVQNITMCFRCDGRGQVESFHGCQTPCSNCDGRGRAQNYLTPTKPCPACTSTPGKDSKNG